MKERHSEHTSQQHEDEIDLLAVVGVLWKRKFLILGITITVALAVFVYALISIKLPPEKSPLPNLYKPEALILVNDNQAGGSLQSALTSAGIASLAGLARASAGGWYGALAVKLLARSTILDSVAERFDIAQRYKIGESVKGNTRKAILSKATFDFDIDTSTLAIAYEDIDPDFATEVVNYFVELLDRKFATIGGNRNIRQRDLLETKLAEVQDEISRTEEELQAFQRKHGILSPQILATEQVALLGEMRARLINKQIEIQTYSEFAYINDPVLVRLKAERDQLQTAISDMENRNFGGIPGENNQDIPALAVEYARLERDIRIQGKIFEVLSQQYELSKLSLEGKEPIFQVLELADVPDLKSGPSRPRRVIVATIGAFFFSVILAFSLNAWENVRKDLERMNKLRGK